MTNHTFGLCGIGTQWWSLKKNSGFEKVFSVKHKQQLDVWLLLFWWCLKAQSHGSQDLKYDNTEIYFNKPHACRITFPQFVVKWQFEVPVIQLVKMLNRNTWKPDLDLLLINVLLVGIRRLLLLFSISQLCEWNKVTSLFDLNNTWGVNTQCRSITWCSFAGMFLEVNVTKGGGKPLLAIWYCCWHINSVHSEGQLIFVSRHAFCHLLLSTQWAAGGGENPIKSPWKQTWSNITKRSSS